MEVFFVWGQLVITVALAPALLGVVLEPSAIQNHKGQLIFDELCCLLVDLVFQGSRIYFLFTSMKMSTPKRTEKEKRSRPLT